MTNYTDSGLQDVMELAQRVVDGVSLKGERMYFMISEKCLAKAVLDMRERIDSLEGTLKFTAATSKDRGNRIMELESVERIAESQVTALRTALEQVKPRSKFTGPNISNEYCLEIIEAALSATKEVE